MLFPLERFSVLLAAAGTDEFDSLLALCDDPDDSDVLEAAWYAYPDTTSGFTALVERITGKAVVFCWCDIPAYLDETTNINGDPVCGSCLDDNYTSCYECSTYVDDDDVIYARNGNGYCENCIASYYTYCGWCEEYVPDGTLSHTNSNGAVCESCLDNNFSWCDSCDEYYHYDDGHDHGCDCEAPQRQFLFPANGAGTVRNEERLTVELAKGTIDDVGMNAIAHAVEAATGLAYWESRDMVAEVGPTWQSRRGNFTRRLSSACYKKHAIKLDSATISTVGNLARAHSSEDSTWHVEFTRHLNADPAEFAHEDSCWWQSYYGSRCCLKNWGGIGLRSYEEGADRECPEGRAWVQPLNDELRPTHDAVNAFAYVVYNGYGEIDGYKAARIVAHLTGRTYRKVSFSAYGQYVNGDSGYLVADEATCEANAHLSIRSLAEHDKLDAYLIDPLSTGAFAA
jgi:hypothetical protein